MGVRHILNCYKLRHNNEVQISEAYNAFGVYLQLCHSWTTASHLIPLPSLGHQVLSFLPWKISQFFPLFCFQWNYPNLCPNHLSFGSGTSLPTVPPCPFHPSHSMATDTLQQRFSDLSEQQNHLEGSFHHWSPSVEDWAGGSKCKMSLVPHCLQN